MPPFRITGFLALLILLVVDHVSSMQYVLLKGTGSNCLSVDPLPSSVLTIKYHLPDLKTKENLEDGSVENEPLNTEGMDEAEAALLQRQREVAVKRVSTDTTRGRMLLFTGSVRVC